MKITTIELNNIKSFSGHHEIQLSNQINILVGANNSGKSTLLSSLLLLQSKTLNRSDISIGKFDGDIVLGFDNPSHYTKISYSGYNSPEQFFTTHQKKIGFGAATTFLVRHDGKKANQSIPQIQAIEPNNLIYPFLSKRKVNEFSEDIKKDSSNIVNGNFTHLYAKVDRLSNPDFIPAYDEYKKACADITGFSVSSTQSTHGKKAALIVRNMDHIPIDKMGEGIANLLALIVDLCIAENKIFLIEEPENDIHPKALKALLKLIEKKSDTNQFIISTHSNIVVKHLGGIPTTKLFKVSMELKERVPHSTVTEVNDDPRERQEVLEDLGYEFNDFSLWKGWLFLEESTAEGIIRDILIPMFLPEIAGKLRTFSCRSVTEVEPKFEDFNKLFVFLHLEPTYKNKGWVIIDGGENEKEILAKMKIKYAASGWLEDHFEQFTEHDFERYYPESFKTDIEETLAKPKGKHRQEAKSILCQTIKQWAEKNPDVAKAEFAISAKEVIDRLKKIAKEIA